MLYIEKMYGDVTPTHIWGTLLWGIIILISWAGWGWSAATVFGGKRDDEVSLGLCCGWGMSVTLALGGLLLVLHSATALVLIVVTIAGCVLAGRGIVGWLRQTGGMTGLRERSRQFLSTQPWWLLAYALPIALLLPSIFAGAFGSFYWNVNDDLPAYFPMVQRILQTGTLIEPFSFRRLVTYGGHSLLQAQVLVARPVDAIFFVEMGLCPIVIMLLAVGLMRPRSPRQHIVAANIATALRLFTVPWQNSHSQLTGTVMFLTLLATLRLLNRVPRRRENWLLLGLVMSGAITLRANFIAFCGVAVVAAYVANTMLHRDRWKQYAQAYGGAILVTAACLLPWALVLYASSNTLFFPLIKGNYRETGLITAPHVAAAATLSRFTDGIVGIYAWSLLLPLVLCFRRGALGEAVPLYLAAVGGAFATLWFSPTLTDWDIYRYSFAVLLAAAIGAIALTPRDNYGKYLGYAAMGVALVSGAANCVFSYSRVQPYPQLFEQGMVVQQGLGEAGFRSKSLLSSRGEGVRTSLLCPGVGGAQRYAQELVPPGSRVLVAIDAPCFLDYNRNSVLLLDMPGLCSPGKGMPFFKGPAALKQYLRSQSIEYLILADFDEAVGMYYRSNWAGHYEAYGPQHVVQGLYFLDAMENLDALANSEQVLGRPLNLRVIKLK